MSTQLILGLETATRFGGVAAASTAGELLAHRFSFARTGFSRRLMPAIDSILDDCSATRDEIAALAVSRGPGSFTGVRLGIVTAKTLAHSLGVPLYLTSTLAGLASRWPERDGVLAALLDARRSEVYSALYRMQGASALAPIREETVEPLAAFLDDARLIEAEEIWFTGDAAGAERTRIEDALGPRARFVPPPWNTPAADSVALEGARRLAAGEPGVQPLAAVPIYLRASDAERNLARSAGRTHSG